MITEIHSPTFNEKLISSSLGCAATGTAMVIDYTCSPLARSLAKIILKTGNQFLLESFTPHEKKGLGNICRVVLADTARNGIWEVVGPYKWVIGGVAECVSDLVEGKKLSPKAFFAGTAAGVAAAGTSKVFRMVLPVERLYHPNSDLNLAQKVAGVALEGALSAAAGQLARNGVYERPLGKGVAQAAFVGGVTSGAFHALEMYKQQREIEKHKSKSDELQKDLEKAKEYYDSIPQEYKDEVVKAKEKWKQAEDAYDNTPKGISPQKAKAEEDLKKAQEKYDNTPQGISKEKEKAYEDLKKAREHYDKVPEWCKKHKPKAEEELKKAQEKYDNTPQGISEKKEKAEEDLKKAQKKYDNTPQGISEEKEKAENEFSEARNNFFKIPCEQRVKVYDAENYLKNANEKIKSFNIKENKKWDSLEKQIPFTPCFQQDYGTQIDDLEKLKAEVRALKTSNSALPAECQASSETASEATQRAIAAFKGEYLSSNQNGNASTTRAGASATESSEEATKAVERLNSLFKGRKGINYKALNAERRRRQALKAKSDAAQTPADAAKSDLSSTK